MSIDLPASAEGGPRPLDVRLYRLGAIGVLAAGSLLATHDLDRAPLEYHEAYVVETAREMARRDDWVVPWFNGEPRLKKPPLGYWLTAGSARAAGRGDDVRPIDGRLPSAAAGIGLVAIVMWLGARLYGRRTSLLAGLMSATSLGFFHYTHSARVDLGYAFLTCLGLVAFVRAWRRGEAGRGTLAPALAMWASFGLATLQKGPQAPATFALGILVWALVEGVPLRRLAGWTRPALGLALLLAMTVPWWLVVHHRLGGSGLAGTQLAGSLVQPGGLSLEYVLFRLPHLLVPWTLLLPCVLALEWRDPLGGRGARLLGSIAVATLAVFSLGPQQRTFYMLPILAPVLVLTAAGTLRVLRTASPASRRRRAIGGLGATVWGLTVVGLAGYPMIADRAPELAAALGARPTGLLVGLVALSATAAAILRHRAFHEMSSLLGLALVTGLAFFALGTPSQAWSKSRSNPERLATRATSAAPAQPAVLTWDVFPDPFVYYAERPVVELRSAAEVVARVRAAAPDDLVFIARADELARLPDTVRVTTLDRRTDEDGRPLALVRLEVRP